MHAGPFEYWVMAEDCAARGICSTTWRAPNLCVSAFPICRGSPDCAHLIGPGAGLLQLLGRYIEMMGSSWTLAVLGVPSAVE